MARDIGELSCLEAWAAGVEEEGGKNIVLSDINFMIYNILWWIIYVAKYPVMSSLYDPYVEKMAFYHILKLIWLIF